MINLQKNAWKVVFQPLSRDYCVKIEHYTPECRYCEHMFGCVHSAVKSAHYVTQSSASYCELGLKRLQMKGTSSGTRQYTCCGMTVQALLHLLHVHVFKMSITVKI